MNCNLNNGFHASEQNNETVQNIMVSCVESVKPILQNGKLLSFEMVESSMFYFTKITHDSNRVKGAQISFLNSFAKS